MLRLGAVKGQCRGLCILKLHLVIPPSIAVSSSLTASPIAFRTAGGTLSPYFSFNLASTAESCAGAANESPLILSAMLVSVVESDEKRSEQTLAARKLPCEEGAMVLRGRYRTLLAAD